MPQPLGPMIATISPRSTTRSTPLSAANLDPSGPVGAPHADRFDERGGPWWRQRGVGYHGLSDAHACQDPRAGAPPPGPMVPIAMMGAVAGAWEADVVLADGGSAHLRPVRATDAASLRALYESLSEESRTSGSSRPRPRRWQRPSDPTSSSTTTTLPWSLEHGDEIVGVADYFRKLDDVAEVAFTVRDDQHGRGLGSLLLDHLAQVAVERGIRSFVAQVLAKNDAMRAVFRDAGFGVAWTRAELGVLQLTLDLGPARSWTDAHRQREHVAEARSIRRVLAPRSIAVVGASARPDSVGGAVLRNLRDGAFTGALYAVNPHAASVGGTPTFPSVAAIDGDVDLAVVAVPAAAVESVVHDCVHKGTHGVVVISSGFAELGDQQRAGRAGRARTTQRHARRRPELRRDPQHEREREHERDVRPGGAGARSGRIRVAIGRTRHRAPREPARSTSVCPASCHSATAPT